LTLRPPLTHERRLGPGRVLRSGTTAGYLALAEVEGEPHLVRADLVGSGAAEPERGRPIVAISHLTDLHVTDVQSPARFEYINREHADPRYRELLPMQRPQEAFNVHAIAAMVRTINAIDAAPITGRPLDLAVMSGDAVDNVQWNELVAFLALLDGGEVRIDGGGPRYEGVQAPGWPDDFFWKPDGAARGADMFVREFGFPHAPGVLERALVPFRSDGLKVRWLGCRGNHEEVCQGVGLVTPRLASAMVGFHKPYRMPEGIDLDDVVETFVRTPEEFMEGPTLPVTPSPDRRPFGSGELIDMQRVHIPAPSAGDHPRAHYVHDVEGVRFVVLDTVCTGGGANGCVDANEAVWLQERLEEVHSRFRSADGAVVTTGREDRLVVLVSHHTVSTLNNWRGEGRARYLESEEVLGIVHRFGNVILWLNGHVHYNVVQPHAAPGGAGGFWEVTTSSLVDWPCQSRLVEIYEAGADRLAIACTLLDHDSPADPAEPPDLASLHRQLAANVPLQGLESGRAGRPEDRNVILLVPRPF
jgi:metallophosphoesterase (TIGR03767 family)